MIKLIVQIITPKWDHSNYWISVFSCTCCTDNTIQEDGFFLFYLGAQLLDLNLCLSFVSLILALTNTYGGLRFSALVWGSSVKHKSQRVGKEHELEDEDVVQIIKKV